MVNICGLKQFMRNFRTEMAIMPIGQICYIWQVNRITSFLLLTLFLFNAIGCYLLFFILNSENRSTMQSDLRKGHHIQLMRIHRSEIKNVVFREEGKEFIFKGEMYDIKSITRDGDFVVFHCINDKTEKRLLAGLETQAKSNGNSGSSDKKQDNASKNHIKDLFCSKENIKIDESIAVVFPSAGCPFTSYISPTLPLPPPESSFS